MPECVGNYGCQRRANSLPGAGAVSRSLPQVCAGGIPSPPARSPSVTATISQAACCVGKTTCSPRGQAEKGPPSSLSGHLGQTVLDPPGYHWLQWATRRRFDPSSSPSASFVASACSLREDVGKRSPVLAAISDLGSGYLNGRTRSFFSEWLNSLQSSGLHGFDTVLEIRVFRWGYEFS